MYNDVLLVSPCVQNGTAGRVNVKKTISQSIDQSGPRGIRSFVPPCLFEVRRQLSGLRKPGHTSKEG